MTATHHQITALKREIADLSAQANNLAQSDSGWRLAPSVYGRLKALRKALLESHGLYLLGDCIAHVTAYRDHQQAEARAHFYATAEPRFVEAHRAIERVTGGRISYPRAAVRPAQ